MRAAPLAIWLAMQWSLMAVVLLRLPVSASGSIAVGSGTVALLIGQAIILSVLAPWLYSSIANTAVALLATLPFVILVAGFDSAPANQTAYAAARLLFWGFTLAAWVNVVPPSRRSIVAAAGTMGVGLGSILAYLANEFGEGTSLSMPSTGYLDWLVAAAAGIGLSLLLLRKRLRPTVVVTRPGEVVQLEANGA